MNRRVACSLAEKVAIARAVGRGDHRPLVTAGAKEVGVVALA